MKKVSYFAIFEKSKDGYRVYFPDLPGCTTTGDNIGHAQSMAENTLGLYLWDLEKSNLPVPDPADPSEFDIPDKSIVIPVNCFPEIVKNDYENKAIKLNVTVPYWLKQLADKEKINYSQLLQAALKEKIGIRNS